MFTYTYKLFQDITRNKVKLLEIYLQIIIISTWWYHDIKKPLPLKKFLLVSIICLNKLKLYKH